MGSSFAFCPWSSNRAACARLDSAPTSITSAPWALSTLARCIPASADRQTLSRYHESADRLITPMTAGRELKEKSLPPMLNSLTRAEAAARCSSTKAARSSSFNIKSKEFGALGGSRTQDRLLRRQMLYPTELRAHLPAKPPSIKTFSASCHRAHSTRASRSEASRCARAPRARELQLPLKPPLFWAIDLHCSRWHIRCGTRWHVLPFDGFTNCVGDLLGLVVGASAFCGFYYLGTAAPRELAKGQTPELA